MLCNFIINFEPLANKKIFSTCSALSRHLHQLAANQPIPKRLSLRQSKRQMATKTAIESQVFGSDRLLVRNVEEFKLHLSLTYPQSCATSLPGSLTYVQPHMFNFNRPKEEASCLTVARIQASLNAHIVSRTAKKTKKLQHQSAASGGGVDVSTLLVDEDDHPNYVRDISVLDAAGNAVDPSKLCADAFANGHTLCLNNSMRYPMLVDPGLVISCRLSTQLLSGFPLHCELQLESCDTCEYRWEISPSLTKPQWQLFSSLKCPSLPVDSAGCFVRMTVLPAGGLQFQQTFGPVTDAVANYVSTRHAFTAGLTAPDSVRVVTYNLLANMYADSDYSRDTLFNWCDPNYLAMSYRKCLIFRELAGYNADLVALQEVDESMFHTGGLRDFMSQCGFAGDCLMKLGKDGKPTQEGLALFYRKSRFELVANRSLASLTSYLASTPELAALQEAVKSNEKFLEVWNPRGQCAQVLVLRHTDQPERLLCLCTTHLFWHPPANLVRLLQMHLILHYLAALKQEYASASASLSASASASASESPSASPDKCTRFSVLLTGDFNSQPDRGPYWLATRGSLSAEHADWFSPGREGMIPRCELSHTLKLSAAYEPQPFTNYTAGFSGHLDHIFYDQGSFRLFNTVPLPTIDHFAHLSALPNRCYPSDHLALIADLELC